MWALALHTGAPTENWEDNTSCIYVVEAKIVTPRDKRIDIPIYFLQEQFENGIFFPKCYKTTFMLADMCTKPCTGPIISRGTKFVTELIFYPTSDA